MGPEYNTVGVAREREIFLAALERLSPEDRETYLKAACGDDPVLRRNIDQLLQVHEGGGGFLEAPAVGTARSQVTTEGAGGREGKAETGLVAQVTEKPGARIGRYRLLQTIGEGGCGIVSMAEQEEPVRRRVALKIIKLGMDTRQVIARFEAERQALAMMSHPNIAQVLDAGATETGRPFFVMELVRGIKITEYCDQNNLSTEDRLRLFIQVCQAIQHAHQKGIIHRDIKPSNILVTLHDGTPVPKVIDFGVAKATGQQRLTDKTVFTAFEQFIGTPAYMSPEQAEMSGLDIDTRSDIYSLGVLLYELLTGKTPFDAETLVRAGLDECRRTIRQDEPDRPSVRLATMHQADLTTAANRRRTEAPKLVHLLKGDLDWVVMKCLEKDRTRRYATASELGNDIRRFLEGEPVLARPPSTWYQLRKLALRYRILATAAAIVVLTLVLASSISISLAVRAIRAEKDAREGRDRQGILRQRAEAERERARAERSQAQVNEYVADINLSHQSLREGNYGRAVQLLEKHLPAAGEPDLRGFEWHYLWQLSRGDDHTLLPEQDGAVHAVSFSPDGQLLAIGTGEKCHVYEFRTGTPKISLDAGAVGLLFSPDGKLLYGSGGNLPGAGLTAWSVETGKPVHSIRDAGPWMALSGDGRLLAASVRGGAVQVWDVSGPVWQETRRIRPAFGPLAFSPDGRSLAGVQESGLTVWSTLDGGQEVVLENSTNLFTRFGPFTRGIHALAFSPDGRFLVVPRNVRSERGIFVLGIWDAGTGREVATMPEDPEHIEHTGTIAALRFSPDGKTLATASLDHTIRLWDFTRMRRSLTLQGHLNEVWALAFSPDGQTLVSGARDGGVKAWHPGQPRQEDVLAGGWQPVAFSHDSRRLAALNSQGLFAWFNVATREPESTLQLSGFSSDRGPRWRNAGSVSVTPDMVRLAEGMQDGSVRLWHLGTREFDVLKVAEHTVSLVSLSRDGGRLVTGGFMQPTRLWDLRAGTNQVLGTEVRNVLFSPDGTLLAAFNREEAELWDVAGGMAIKKLDIGANAGFAAAFSPDGRRLAVAASPSETDNGIRLFEVADGRLVGTCSGHKQPVFSVAFSPDGRTLASGSDDSTLRLWNVQTQQELMAIRRLGGGLVGLTFSPDGQLLAGYSRASMQTLETRLIRAPFLKP